MKITKAMIKKLDDEHFDLEDEDSLTKLHALKSLYHSQRGEYKLANKYITDKKVQRKVIELGSKKDIKKRKTSTKKRTPIQKRTSGIDTSVDYPGLDVEVNF